MFINPLFLGKIGLTEILVILLIVVIFFGGRKIPELMRGMGRGVKEFKDAMDKDYSASEPKAPRADGTDAEKSDEPKR
ncbi:twin-arginine translocase TatA/TatE family subunit [Alistipes sp.]|uniref:twin-arginine translocase TatA/TatE family subunit n=1 Tax=Alistipes sp. TaxID=1872444 RepID=UPI003AF02D9B